MIALASFITLVFANSISGIEKSEKYSSIDNIYLDFKYSEKELINKLPKKVKNRDSNEIYRLVQAISIKHLMGVKKEKRSKKYLDLLNKYSLEYPELQFHFYFMSDLTHGYLANKDYKLYNSLYIMTKERFKDFIGEDSFCFDFSHKVFDIYSTAIDIENSYFKCQNSNGVDELKSVAKKVYKIFKKKDMPFESLNEFHQYQKK